MFHKAQYFLIFNWLNLETRSIADTPFENINEFLNI